MPRAARRPAAVLAAALALSAAAGCASVRTLVRSYDVADDGLQREEHDLRAALDDGAFDSALVRVRSRERAAPRDPLLREMYGGLVAYYAGRYDESARDLDGAAVLAEERYTKSVSRGGAALATNDMALRYMPGRTERLLVHYYAMLGYLRRDSAEAAAVEARRMSRLLDQYGEGRDDREAALHGTLHYLAGAAFEAAGQRADADVSYRNAALLLPAVAMPSARADSAPRRGTRRAGASRAAPVPAPAPPTGDVIVVVEWGYVAHRVQHDLAVAVDSNEIEGLAFGFTRHADSAGGGDAIARVVRQLERRDDRHRERERGREHDAEHGGRWRDGGDHGVLLGHDAYVLHVAWPALEHAEPALAPAGVVADSGAATPLRVLGDVTEAADADFGRDRPAVVARAVTRAAVKYAATRAAHDKGGKVTGFLADASGALLERADTRSWQLLPAYVGVLRLTLPAGTHRLALDLRGAGAGPNARATLGDVVVVPGRLTVATARLWRAAAAPAAGLAASAAAAPAH